MLKPAINETVTGCCRVARLRGHVTVVECLFADAGVDIPEGYRRIVGQGKKSVNLKMQLEASGVFLRAVSA